MSNCDMNGTHIQDVVGASLQHLNLALALAPSYYQYSIRPALVRDRRRVDGTCRIQLAGERCEIFT
jgi:hypothetical protein